LLLVLAILYADFLRWRSFALRHARRSRQLAINLEPVYAIC
jgi:hypothetical protein